MKLQSLPYQGRDVACRTVGKNFFRHLLAPADLRQRCRHFSLVHKLEVMTLGSEAALLLLGMISHFAQPTSGSLEESVVNISLLGMVAWSVVMAIVYEIRLFRKSSSGALRMELRLEKADNAKMTAVNEKMKSF